jgi:hypothetical protein
VNQVDPIEEFIHLSMSVSQLHRQPENFAQLIQIAVTLQLTATLPILLNNGCKTPSSIRSLSLAELLALPGITAEAANRWSDWSNGASSSLVTAPASSDPTGCNFPTLKAIRQVPIQQEVSSRP